MRTQHAAQWLMRLQGDNVPQTEIAAWLDWCNADPRNLEAFDRAQSLYDGLKSADESVRNDFLRLAEEKSRSSPAQLMKRTWRSNWGWSATAAAVVLFAAGVMWQFQPLKSLDLETQHYKTAHAASRNLTLADKSQVILGAATTLTSQYSAVKRYVELEDGEAFFKVHHDRLRPFVVQAGPVTVTAVGTAFNIRRMGERTVISVTEGAVDVASFEAKSSPPVRVSGGQQAIHAPNIHGLMVSSVDPAAVTARQDGRFEYIAEPLGSVLQEINRYSPHPIIAADEQVRNLVFTGTVFRQRAEEWALALHTVFPVNVSRRDDGSVVLEARR